MSMHFTDITEAKLEAATKGVRFHEGAHPRTELANALLQINAGFRAGGTYTQCLRDLGLVGVRSLKPTKRGSMFLFDCFNGLTCEPWSGPIHPDSQAKR